MSIPINIVFWIDSITIQSNKYKSLIASYYAKFAGVWPTLNQPIAYLRVSEEEKKILPDIIDFLYDMDIKPIAEDGNQLKERRISDIGFILERQEIDPNISMLLIRNNIISPQGNNNLVNILSQGIKTLWEAKEVVSIGFQRQFEFIPLTNINQIYSVDKAVKWPALVRTRDLYVADILSQQVNNQSIESCLQFLSNRHIRNLSFNQSIATTTIA